MLAHRLVQSFRPLFPCFPLCSRQCHILGRVCPHAAHMPLCVSSYPPFASVNSPAAAGSAISSGVFVPMLLIGACIGRLVGLVVVDIAAARGAGSQG